MSLQGSLQDMTVADLIQHNCLDRKTSRLVIEHDGRQASLFFKGGSVIDAVLGELRGEEAVYSILSWQEGVFTLDQDQEAPAVTISRSWSSLLLEGARLIDEANHTAAPNGPVPDLDTLFEDESEAFETEAETGRFSEVLTKLLAVGTDLEGAAVVGVDGSVHAARLRRGVLPEENDINAAAWATILSLSKQSVEQFKRGGFNQTLIQGNQGNIIIADLNEELIFVGLIPADVNLGIVFSEARTAIEKLNQAVGN